ncbi:MAG: hydantoinase/oxoprolinase family protein, partial [Anaerolineales bacterium]
MLIGVDVGGTFTDFAVFDGRLSTFKALSTPQAPELAVLEGLASIADSDSASVSHGTTVGTNAVLERRGARTAFVATAGFRDLLLIGRQNRSSIYDLFSDRPAPVIPAERSFEVKERLDREGQTLTRLEDSEIGRVVADVRAVRAEAVAVCLLFSFLDPAHERRLEDAFRAAGIPVSISSRVLPEFREYERASATALDAYLAPRLGEYLGRLEAALPGVRLRIMQSNGGSLQPALARQRAVHSLLSGPAGGAIGARLVARAAGFHNLITLDMGGTSSDVSLIEGEPRLTTSAHIEGLPIGVPVIDLHTVGAGGGSLASVDAGGALRVGPRSAGADPGPVCYGRGGRQPTATDADVVLGHLPIDTFTAGGIRLDLPAAAAALAELASQADLHTVGALSPAQTAALG